MSRIDIVPTCVARSAEDLVSSVQKIRAFSSSIHLDVDDGMFAPHVSWPYESEGVPGQFDLSLLAGMSVEVHLMTERPQQIGEAFARAGASRIAAHLEAFEDEGQARAALAAWRKAGASEVGIAFLFGTPLGSLDTLAAECDFLHMMSIAEIGTQGIPYEPGAPERVAALRARFPNAAIAVDGGVSLENIAALVRAGATHFSVGSALMRSGDPVAAYAALKAAAESAIQ